MEKKNTILGQLNEYFGPAVDALRVPQKGEPGYYDVSKIASNQYQKPVDDSVLNQNISNDGMIPNSDLTNMQKPISQSNLVGIRPIAQSQNDVMPSQMLNKTDMFIPGYGTQMQGISQQMLADQTAARAQGQFAKQLADQTQAIDQDYKEKLDLSRQKVDEKMSEIEGITKEIQSQGAINPNRWWQNKNTGEKIGASIAIGLGALGAGLTGSNQNLALDQINRAIQLDLLSQEKTLQSKSDSLQAQQSLLGMYMSKTNNLEDAKALAKRDSYALAEIKLNETLAGVKSQEAKSKGLILMGQLQNEKAKINAELMGKIAQQSQFQNIRGGGSVDPLSLPEGMRDQVVRVGNEYRVALNREAAKEVSRRLPSMDSMQEKINKIKELVEKNPFPFLKMPTEAKGQIQSLSRQLILGLKSTEGLGALDEGTVKIGNEIIGDATSFFDTNNIAKLNSLNESIEGDRQRMLKQNVLGYQGLK